MRKTFLPVACVLFILSSCNDIRPKPDTASPTKEISAGRKIRNDIQLQPKGLKVSQAFLMYEDGSLVPPGNETNVNKPVKMRLIFDGGWKETDGKVSVGASEKIETSDGQVLLDEKDLFQNTGPVEAESAKIIALTANISQLDKLYDYFLVSFRVWDKNGDGEVTGNYKLYIK